MLKIPKWHTLRTAADWQAVATEFLTEAVEAARSGDTNKMSEVCDALGLFIQKRTTKCPQETVDAVFGAHGELTRLVAADIAGSIASRTVQLKAYLNDIETVSERVARQARLIGLEPVTRIVSDAEKVVTDLKKLKRAIGDGESPTDLKAKVEALITTLETAVTNIRNEMPDEDA